jgi:cytochrome c oxidase subunit IV
MNTDAERPAPSAWALWRRNGLIWLALLVLLFFSLQSAYLRFDPWTTVIGLVIACVKAALVTILFMELAQAKALTRLTALAGLVFLAALFLLTLTDVLSRLALG